VAGLRFVQKALPLGVKIDKIGEAQIGGSARSFDLAVYPASSPGDPAIPTVPTQNEFVHGHFWQSSEADRLREPTFDRLKAGFELAGNGALHVDALRGVTTEYGYELIVIGPDDDAAGTRLLAFTPFVAGGLSRWMEATHRAAVSPLDPRAGTRRPADAPRASDPAFEFADGPAAAGVAEMSFGDMRLTATGGLRNPVVADYVMAAVAA
jgi:hypothetical protein